MWPNTFEIDFWGTKAGDDSEYRDFQRRKIKGNILLAAYYSPVTLQEISIELGVALPYLEDEIKLLVDRRYLVCNGGKYLTNIPIFTPDCTKAIDGKLKELIDESAQKIVAIADDFDTRFGNRFANANLANWQIGEKYIANDVMLDSQTQQIIIITGPNMAGKSALLRQTALITLLAQIGSFVPAESAHIGLVDKIFTRVGASDNISVGESTFMVEMNEAADILNNLSPRSLVLFDELGRGTSTYDGISIAWAIVEHIHEHPKAKARTLFATHYHELNEMEKSFKRIKNYNVSVKEIDNKVIFLRKLERGGSEHSFGIHVAKMAGMPKSIVKRANDILKQLETDNRQQGISSKPMVEVGETRGGMQLSFFQLDDPVLCQIRDEILNLDVNNLTPLEALNKLNDIKRIVKGK